VKITGGSLYPSTKLYPVPASPIIGTPACSRHFYLFIK